MNKYRHLILQLHSSDNQSVRKAVDGLQKIGCLSDGSLNGLELRHVHLTAADLTGARLQQVNLSMADMRWTDLCSADLQGAQLHHDFSTSGYQSYWR
jgi:uncharacterized protein YjbI with pentapeptide repeats